MYLYKYIYRYETIHWTYIVDPQVYKKKRNKSTVNQNIQETCKNFINAELSWTRWT